MRLHPLLPSLTLGVSLVLAGCGSPGVSTPTGAGPSTPEPTASGPTSGGEAEPTMGELESTLNPTDPGALPNPLCTALTPAELQTLAGGTLPDPVDQEVNAVPGCRWGSDPRAVQVAQGPAQQWVRALSASEDRLDDSAHLDAQERDRLEALITRAHDPSVTPAQACEVFTALIELQDGTKGATSWVRPIPDSHAPNAVAGESCVGGVWTGVVVSAPDLLGRLPATRQLVQRHLAALTPQP